VTGIVGLDWVTADEEYGPNGDRLDEWEELGQRYVMEVPTTTTVWTADPASCVPPYSGRGQPPPRPRPRAGGPGAPPPAGGGRRPRGGGDRGCGGGGGARGSSRSRRWGSGRPGTVRPARRSGC